MKAVQYRTFGAGPELVEIEKPSPGPGRSCSESPQPECAIRDSTLMSRSEQDYAWSLPQTLGHEPISTSNWGRRSQLSELASMARRGQIDIETTAFTIDEAVHAYHSLEGGPTLGRGIVAP